MNIEWSDRNKAMQSKLKKSTFQEGIRELTELRDVLMSEMLSWREVLTKADYSAIPYLNAAGYHSKTVAYSIWHIMRIEDIVVNSLINDREEILFSGGFDKKTGADIITTGNELVGLEIARFSEKLDIESLYNYALAVKACTDEWIQGLCYEDINKRFSEDDAALLTSLNVVADNDNARWLIHYWCGKDIGGIIRMPLSRHWIMHIEAANRIIKRIKQK